MVEKDVSQKKSEQKTKNAVGTAINDFVTSINLDEYAINYNLPKFTVMIAGDKYTAALNTYQDFIELFKRQRELDEDTSLDGATRQQELLRQIFPDIPDDTWDSLDPRLGSSLLYAATQYIYRAQNAAFSDLENFKKGKD